MLVLLPQGPSGWGLCVTLAWVLGITSEMQFQRCPMWKKLAGTRAGGQTGREVSNSSHSEQKQRKKAVDFSLVCIQLETVANSFNAATREPERRDFSLDLIPLSSLLISRVPYLMVNSAASYRPFKNTIFIALPYPHPFSSIYGDILKS